MDGNGFHFREHSVVVKLTYIIIGKADLFDF
jgi:hypothetical protein